MLMYEIVRKIIFVFLTFGFLVIFTVSIKALITKKTSVTGAPPYGEPEQNSPDLGVLSWFTNWKRPIGPPKVALQVGHWKNNELPDELEKLKGNSGASGGGKEEWEVNFALANEVSKLLQEKGVEVDMLPATVPSSYWADVFLAIHADGSTDETKSGYKIASPWRDYTNSADDLINSLEDTYARATNFSKDDNVTRNMRGYYAFSWWKYEHAIHPMTTAAIIETGFLTNTKDRNLLVNNPQIPARGIADGILNYLFDKGLIDEI
jgi:hypothetical protein